MLRGFSSYRPLRQPSRNRIYALIVQRPGLHFRQIQRDTGMGVGSVRYQLSVLERNNIIVSERIHSKLRFYPASLGNEQRKLLGVLRQETVRRIMILLIERPGLSHGEISRQTGISPSTATWHLKRLRTLNVVQCARTGREMRCWVNGQQVARILADYRQSFLDKMVDNFVSMWTEG